MFKPTPKQVAKKFYKEMASISGKISYTLQEDYELIQNKLRKHELLNLCLIAIAQEAHIKGLSIVRGEYFSIKVDREICKIDPFYARICAICYNGYQNGKSISISIAEYLYEEVNRDGQLQISVEGIAQFLDLYRESAYSIVDDGLSKTGGK